MRRTADGTCRWATESVRLADAIAVSRIGSEDVPCLSQHGVVVVTGLTLSGAILFSSVDTVTPAENPRAGTPPLPLFALRPRQSSKNERSALMSVRASNLCR